MTVVQEISLSRGCTFDPDDWAILATHWYPVALSRDVTTEPVAAQLLDESLVIYRARGELVIANDVGSQDLRPYLISADRDSLLRNRGGANE